MNSPILFATGGCGRNRNPHGETIILRLEGQVTRNPYFYGHRDWRFKDGDTCIGCGPDEIGALPVADAYQELHRSWDEENCEIRESLDEMERQWAEETAKKRWEQTTGALYDLQDQLCGIR